MAVTYYVGQENYHLTGLTGNYYTQLIKSLIINDPYYHQQAKIILGSTEAALKSSPYISKMTGITLLDQKVSTIT